LTARKAAIGVLATALCAACVFYIFRTYRWDEVGRLLAGGDMAMMFIGSSLGIVAYYGLRAARWHLMLRAAGKPAPFASVFEATTLSVGIAVLTPASAAEAIKVEMLKRNLLTDRATGYSSFISERVLDGVVLALVGLAGVQRASLFSGSWIPEILLGGGLLGALVLAGIARSRGHRVPAAVVVVTLLGWLAVGAAWHACFAGLKIEVPFAGTLTVMALSTILSVLSFIPGGIGVSELSIAALLELLGAPTPAAQAGSLAIRVLTLWVLALGLALWGAARYVGKVPNTSS
jgi:uncharacterized membrane protein YbhN (UPF0104 family)